MVADKCLQTYWIWLSNRAITIYSSPMFTELDSLSINPLFKISLTKFYIHIL